MMILFVLSVDLKVSLALPMLVRTVVNSDVLYGVPRPSLPTAKFLMCAYFF